MVAGTSKRVKIPLLRIPLVSKVCAVSVVLYNVLFLLYKSMASVSWMSQRMGDVLFLFALLSSVVALVSAVLIVVRMVVPDGW